MIKYPRISEVLVLFFVKAGSTYLSSTRWLSQQRIVTPQSSADLEVELYCCP